MGFRHVPLLRRDLVSPKAWSGPAPTRKHRSGASASRAKWRPLVGRGTRLHLISTAQRLTPVRDRAPLSRPCKLRVTGRIYKDKRQRAEQAEGLRPSLFLRYVPTCRDHKR